MKELLVFSYLLVNAVHGLDNGLARTPPMGWISWERFQCETDCTDFPEVCIGEKLYMNQADALVGHGLDQLGYKYINMDDCWPAKTRDAETGKLVPDPQRFPSGMAALAEYMHQRGLKLGIYEDFGTTTCAGYPGSEFFLEKDANTFAEWQVDMLKFDGCNSDAKDMDVGYPLMGFFLNKTGRPILFSCEWPLYQGDNSNYTAIQKTCNMWRNGHDIYDSWDSVTSIIKQYGDNANNFSSFSGPGSWADPDMLVVGNYGLSIDQQRSQFGMYAMFSAPLFMSNDLTSISQEALNILKNKDVIDIDQDPLGIKATRISSENNLSIWTKPLIGQRSAVAFLYEFDFGGPMQITTSLSKYGFNGANGYNVTSLFDSQIKGIYKPTSTLTFFINPTGIVIFRVDPL